MLIELDYLKKFKCVGSDCLNTCCGGWSVYAQQEALDNINNKIKKLSTKKKYDNFSKAYKKFKSSNDEVYILADKNNTCMFLDKHKLCTLHKQFHHSILPTGCQQFPRRFIYFPKSEFNSGSFGCPEISRMALFQNRILDVVIDGKEKKSESINFLNLNEGHDKQLDRYAINGQKIINLIYKLFLDKNNIHLILRVVNQVTIDREYLESKPSQIEEIFFFIYEVLKKENITSVNKDKFQLLFFKNFFSSIIQDDLHLPVKKILEKNCKDFFVNNKKSILKFKKNRILFDKLLKKHSYFEQNYFINEILGKLHCFTRKSLDSQEMIGKAILIYSISRFFCITCLSKNNEKNIEYDFLKILSQTTKCFDGINFRKMIQLNKNIFNELILLF